MNQAEAVDRIFSPVPVLPVLTIERAEDAVPLARALSGAGLSVLEVVLRTSAALDAIGRISAELPEVTVGAGTVLKAADLDAAVDAGANFAISPGATDKLYAAAAQAPIPLMPAVATGSEIMRGLEHGYGRFKFFPAAANGGTGALKILSGPFPGVRFCPTGGMDADSAARYLALPNVFIVGGTWMVPTEALREKDWDRIAELAAACSGLV